jgi:hypothetical protein
MRRIKTYFKRAPFYNAFVGIDPKEVKNIFVLLAIQASKFSAQDLDSGFQMFRNEQSSDRGCAIARSSSNRSSSNG